jgi:hypothetical protein
MYNGYCIRNSGYSSLTKHSFLTSTIIFSLVWTTLPALPLFIVYIWVVFNITLKNMIKIWKKKERMKYKEHKSFHREHSKNKTKIKQTSLVACNITQVWQNWWPYFLQNYEIPRRTQVWHRHTIEDIHTP